MSVIRLVLPALLTSLAASAVAQAQSRPGPIAAIEALFDALASGDRDTLTGLISARDEAWSPSRVARDALVQYILDRRELEQAAVARFGETGRRLAIPYAAIFSLPDRAALGRAQVQLDRDRIEGDPAGQPIFARVLIEGETRPILVEQSAEGRWRVVVPMVSLLGAEPGARDLGYEGHRTVLALRGLSSACETVSRGIREGSLATIQAAENEFLALCASAWYEAYRQSRSERRWR